MDKFAGFEVPKQNYSKLPHSFTDALPDISTVSELKCILYVLRHTWGYQEYGVAKKITVDEFMDGRKKKDGSRLDRGTGLSHMGVFEGLKRAVDDGFLIVEEDNSDAARQKRYYMLNMQTPELLTPDEELLTPTIRTSDTVQRKKQKKETKEKQPPSLEELDRRKRQKEIVDALAKHFLVTIRWGADFDRKFLDWALDEVHMTPDQIEYAVDYWKDQTWLKTPGRPGISLIQRDWLLSIEGFGEQEITDDIDWQVRG